MTQDQSDRDPQNNDIEDNKRNSPFTTPPPLNSHSTRAATSLPPRPNQHGPFNPQVYKNNTQFYDFEEAIPQKDKPKHTHQIGVIMDTGATFTMLPSQFEFAWTNLTPCLHTIEGCFKGGGTNKSTQIGEFHALITLNSGETRRLIIPQARIINKQSIKGKNNVFALFLDLHTGWIAAYPQPNRGLREKL
jgi:hypothetical protein